MYVRSFIFLSLLSITWTFSIASTLLQAFLHNHTRMVLLNSSLKMSHGPLKPSVALLICLARVKLLHHPLFIMGLLLLIFSRISLHPASLPCGFGKMLPPPAIIIAKFCQSSKVFELQTSNKYHLWYHSKGPTPWDPKNLIQVMDTVPVIFLPRLHIRITYGLGERWGGIHKMFGHTLNTS